MTWEEVFRNIKSKDYAIQLSHFLDEEYANHKIYPERKNMFNAFKLTPLEEVKVVIFGQDPYHEEGQAMGKAREGVYREESQRQGHIQGREKHFQECDEVGEGCQERQGRREEGRAEGHL